MKKLFVAISALLFSSIAIAQDRYGSVLSSGSLETISGKKNSYYSKGYKVRAEALQKLIDNCVSYYKKKIPETKFDVRVFVLDENDWKLLPAVLPYGMPFSDSNNIVIAADRRAGTALFGIPDNLPDSVMSPFDNIVLHELGHTFFTLSSLEVKQKWVNEFIASYFAICYLREVSDGEYFPRIDESEFQPTYRSLEDFERLYFEVGAQNYGWYEGQFIKLAYSLHPDLKIKLIKKIIELYKTQPDTDASVVLRNLSPLKYDKWLLEMR